MDIVCQWPDTLDKYLLKRNWTKKLNQVPTFNDSPLSGYPDLESYIFGDFTCPLTLYCVEEHGQCIYNEEVIFNKLRGARNQTDCALGQLKERLAMVIRSTDFKLEKARILLYACFL